MQDAFIETSQPSPKLAYIYAAKPAGNGAELFEKAIKTLLKGVDYDALGELAQTIRSPIETSNPYNGGCWAEGFTTKQIPHIHHDDGQNASERYLFLMPVHGDGAVDIFPSDQNDHKGERFIFKEGIMYLLHFDGACPHRFETLGTDPESMLCAFAIHTRDVATTMDALVKQTDLLTEPLPKIAEDQIYSTPQTPPEISILEYLRTAERRSRMGNDLGMIERNLTSAAIEVSQNGKGFGAEKFRNINSLRRWRDCTYDRDLTAVPAPAA